MKPTIEGQIDIRTLGEIAIAADEGAMRDPWPASIIEALKHRDYPMNGQEIFIEAIRHFFKRRPPKSSIVRIVWRVRSGTFVVLARSSASLTGREVLSYKSSRRWRGPI